MGVVYAAHDDRLGRPVALKMIRQASDDRSARERLWREARSAASVSHPNICQLYEIGEEEGELFIAMELLEGEALAQRLTRGPLPVPEASQTALAMMAALAALHHKGLVHRDLKPSNVFLTPVGVKLLDFGLARPVTDSVAQTEVGLTQPGNLVGTPLYMAPEQFLGAPVDARTDLFAAGAIVFEMLSGKPPFSGQTVIQVFQAVTTKEPPVLGGSPIVAAVDRIIHKAMAKGPEHRYQTADAMMDDLRAAMRLTDSAETVQAVPLTRLIVLPFRILRPDPETDFLAYSIPDEITTSLSGLQSLVVRSSVTASRFAGGPSLDLQAVAAQAEVDVVLTGTLVRAGDQIRVNTQLVAVRDGTVLWSESAQVPLGDVFTLQTDLVQRIVRSLPLTVGDRRRVRRDVPATTKAYELYLRANQLVTQAANWTIARDLYLQCLEDDPQYAPAWARLGRAYRLLGLYGGPSGAENHRLAREAFARALELNPELSIAHNLYTNLEVEMGRGKEAMLRLLQRTRERTADPELYAGLVQACRYCDLLEASVAAYERARRLDPGIKTSVSHTYFALGDYERSVATCVDEPPFIKAWALQAAGREDEALALLRELEQASLPKPVLRLVTGTRMVIEGTDPEMALQWNQEFLTSFRDPCGLFYTSRHVARLGNTQAALDGLRRAVEGGFYCFALLTRDPWLDLLRSHPEFREITHLAESRYRDALDAFVQADGNRVLGLGARM